VRKITEAAELASVVTIDITGERTSDVDAGEVIAAAAVVGLVVHGANMVTASRATLLAVMLLLAATAKECGLAADLKTPTVVKVCHCSLCTSLALVPNFSSLFSSKPTRDYVLFIQLLKLNFCSIKNAKK